jgi:two-component system, NarL family, sensor kinase
MGGMLGTWQNAPAMWLLDRRRRLGRRILSATVAGPMVQFGMAGVVALVVLSTMLTLVLDQTGLSEAISNARQITSLVGQDVIEPSLTDALLDGGGSARSEFDQTIRQRVIRGPVVRVKIWDTTGRVVYSDEPRLIGSSFALEQDQITALSTGQVVANPTDLSRPENVYEANHGDRQLLEVYMRLHTPGGTTVLYENYLRFDAVQATGRQIMLNFLPAVAGTLILMQMVQLSLAWSLARKVRDGQRDREGLLMRAVDAAEMERRRIARDLHDGTVQDLTAVSLALEVASRQLRREGQLIAAGTLDHAAAETRASVRQLRTLFVDIYPNSLRDQGLEVALRDLLGPFGVRGIATTLSVEPDLRLQAETERLLYRVAREALRNVAAHARARAVDVRVAADNCTVSLSVRDDGLGFDTSTFTSHSTGHLGLQLLNDLTQDAGGTFQVTSRHRVGTQIRVELPRQ